VFEEFGEFGGGVFQRCVVHGCGEGVGEGDRRLILLESARLSIIQVVWSMSRVLMLNVACCTCSPRIKGRSLHVGKVRKV
jgi:hypothetical protein